MLKIGIDIHEVIDADPEYFSKFTKMLKMLPNVEIHIVTGGMFKDVKDDLKNWGIEYDQFFSICDYHYCLGTITWTKEDGTVRMSDEDWNKTKGDYAAREGLHIMIDDTLEYKRHMPNITNFIHYKKEDSAKNISNNLLAEELFYNRSKGSGW